jgi:hypothetical protein
MPMQISPHESGRISDVLFAGWKAPGSETHTPPEITSERHFRASEMSAERLHAILEEEGCHVTQRTDGCHRIQLIGYQNGRRAGEEVVRIENGQLVSKMTVNSSTRQEPETSTYEVKGQFNLNFIKALPNGTQIRARIFFP